MTRYAIIDNVTGRIWGDSACFEGKSFDGTPLEFARKVEEIQGFTGTDCRIVSRDALTSHESGYHVFRVGKDVPPFWHDSAGGWDQKTIDAVKRNYVTTVQTFNVE